MEQTNWEAFPFAIVSTIFGVFIIFSSCYERPWWWWFGRGHLPDMIGRTIMRSYIGGVGIVVLALGIKENLRLIFFTESVLLYPVGFVISITLAALLYELRPTQSVRELSTAITERVTMRKAKRKPKKKKEEDYLDDEILSESNGSDSEKIT